MSLRSRFLVLTALFILLIISSFAFLRYQNQQMTSSRTSIENDWKETRYLSEFEQVINSVHQEFEAHGIDTDRTLILESLTNAANLMEDIYVLTASELHGNEGEMKEFEALKKLSETLDRWKELTNSPPERFETPEAFLQEMNSVYSESFQLTARYRLGSYEELEEALQQMTNHERANQHFITRTTVGMLLLLSAAWFGFGYWLLRPIRKLKHMIQRVKERRYDRATEYSAGGEIGEVIRSFQDLVMEIQRFTSELEDRVQERTIRLENSQKQLRQMIDNLPGAAIALVGSDQRVIMANSSYGELSGKSDKSVLSSIRKSPRLPPGYYEWKSGGKKKILDVHLVPLDSTDKDEMVSLEYINNLTHQVEIEAALASSQKLAAIGRFASGVSHEINNPLTAVAACSEGLLKRLESGEMDHGIFKEYLTTIRDEVYRCKGITGKLLKNSSRNSSKIENCDVSLVVHDTILLTNSIAESRKVRIENRVTESHVIVTNQQALRQILMNLILNGIDACGAGGKMSVDLKRDGDKMNLEVKDDGIGIEPDEFENIFEPFYTNRKDQSGTGLGLYVCQSLTESLGGTIRAFSDGKGKGARFVVCLPANRQEISSHGDSETSE